MKNKPPSSPTLKKVAGLCLALLLLMLSNQGGIAQSGAGAVDPDSLTGPARDALDLLRNGADLPQADFYIQASAKNGAWEFQFQSGEVRSDGKSTPLASIPLLRDLVLPQNANAILTITAYDAIYPFIVPDLDIRKDAVPGRLETLKIDASQAGVYRSVCDASCGDRSESLSFTIHILKPDAFADWIARRTEAPRIKQ